MTNKNTNQEDTERLTRGKNYYVFGFDIPKDNIILKITLRLNSINANDIIIEVNKSHWETNRTQEGLLNILIKKQIVDKNISTQKGTKESEWDVVVHHAKNRSSKEYEIEKTLTQKETKTINLEESTKKIKNMRTFVEELTLLGKAIIALVASLVFLIGGLIINKGCKSSGPPPTALTPVASASCNENNIESRANNIRSIEFDEVRECVNVVWSEAFDPANEALKLKLKSLFKNTSSKPVLVVYAPAAIGKSYYFKRGAEIITEGPHIGTYPVSPDFTEEKQYLRIIKLADEDLGKEGDGSTVRIGNQPLNELIGDRESSKEWFNTRKNHWISERENTTVVFDDFDEIHPDASDEILKQTINLSEKNNVRFIILTRPEAVNWQDHKINDSPKIDKTRLFSPMLDTRKKWAAMYLNQVGFKVDRERFKQAKYASFEKFKSVFDEDILPKRYSGEFNVAGAALFCGEEWLSGEISEDCGGREGEKGSADAAKRAVFSRYETRRIYAHGYKEGKGNDIVGTLWYNIFEKYPELKKGKEVTFSSTDTVHIECGGLEDEVLVKDFLSRSGFVYMDPGEIRNYRYSVYPTVIVEPLMEWTKSLHDNLCISKSDQHTPDSNKPNH